MKKKMLMMLLTASLVTTVLSGCGKKPDALPVDDSVATSDDESTDEQTEVIDSSQDDDDDDVLPTPDPYDFLIFSNYVPINDDLHYVEGYSVSQGTYNPDSSDYAYTVNVDWSFPITILAENAKTVTIVPDVSPLSLSGDYEDCIVSSELDETGTNYYYVTFDFDTMSECDFSIDLHYSQYVFETTYYGIDSDDFTEKRQAYDDVAYRFEILYVIVEYEDGSVCCKSISPDVYMGRDNVEIGLTTNDSTCLFMTRPADGGDSDIVYYGDTVTVSASVDESYRSEDSWDDEQIYNPVGEMTFEVTIPNDTFKYFDGEDCIRFLSSMIGSQVGDERYFLSRGGDPIQSYEVEILEIEY